MKKERGGFSLLSSRAMAVIAATFGTLLQVRSEAQIVPDVQVPDSTRINYEEYQKKILKPKLVLKLNMSNPDNSLLAFHSSHSSHRSHSSHSSHSSHYSSSSSGSYMPSYTPIRSAPVYHAPKNSSTSTGTGTHGISGSYFSELTSTSDYYSLGSRVLYNGCKGTDVKELQRLLVALNYRLIVTGYFGDQTEAAVIKFQKSSELDPNGKVDAQTLQLIQKKAMESRIIKEGIELLIDTSLYSEM